MVSQVATGTGKAFAYGTGAGGRSNLEKLRDGSRHCNSALSLSFLLRILSGAAAKTRDSVHCCSVARHFEAWPSASDLPRPCRTRKPCPRPSPPCWPCASCLCRSGARCASLFFASNSLWGGATFVLDRCLSLSTRCHALSRRVTPNLARYIVSQWCAPAKHQCLQI